jgi:hypothetical protein
MPSIVALLCLIVPGAAPLRLIFGFAIALAAFGASSVEYFPSGSLGETAEEHQFMADWYTKHLAAMQEPFIWQMSHQKSADEVYRFFYLRSLPSSNFGSPDHRR